MTTKYHTFKVGEIASYGQNTTIRVKILKILPYRHECDMYPMYEVFFIKSQLKSFSAEDMLYRLPKSDLLQEIDILNEDCECGAKFTSNTIEHSEWCPVAKVLNGAKK
jgi:hypothetical protein